MNKPSAMRRVVFFCLINSFFLLGEAHAVERKKATVEVFSLPQFKGKISADAFNGVGVDYSRGNIAFVKDGGWCEIPFKRRNFIMDNAFIAPTEGYNLKAVASAPQGVFVFDALADTIMTDKKVYRVEKKIKSPSGMAYHKGSIYIADDYLDVIYELKLSQNRAHVKKSYYSCQKITGLASDGEFLYASQRNKIFKFDDFMEVIGEYEVNKPINGLTYVGNGEFVGVADSRAEIYRIKF